MTGEAILQEKLLSDSNSGMRLLGAIESQNDLIDMRKTFGAETETENGINS